MFAPREGLMIASGLWTSGYYILFVMVLVNRTRRTLLLAVIVVVAIIWFGLNSGPFGWVTPPRGGLSTLAFSGDVSKTKALVSEMFLPRKTNSTEIAVLPRDWERDQPNRQFEIEELSVDLTGEEITTLISTYRPDTVPLKDVRVWTEDGYVFGTGVSGYPLLSGRVSVKGRVVPPGVVRLEDVYLGVVKIPDNQTFFVGEVINDLIFGFLSSVGVEVGRMSLANDVVAVEVSAPKGLVTVSEEKKIQSIDSDILSLFLQNPVVEFDPEPWKRWMDSGEDASIL